MQQTLLALGALLIITTISMNQQRSIFMLQRTAYVRELEAAAHDYARLRLGEIAGLWFDETRVGATTLNTDTDDLTFSTSFGTESGETAPNFFDDIDDFEGFVDSTVVHSLSNETYRLRERFDIQYIDPANPGMVPGPGVRTLTKRVIITVESAEEIGQAVRIEVDRLVSVSDYVQD